MINYVLNKLTLIEHTCFFHYAPPMRSSAQFACAKSNGNSQVSRTAYLLVLTPFACYVQT